ncbi:N-lysine methyltransferase KMT5A-like [Babylonia areolata]|uniref:N-lysine methyltransferase KMT5A-like n=1 Tax=Babylonia areolata TaxID=304850 RepID=UPI003FD5D850
MTTKRKGRGVMAVREFQKGDFVLEFTGELISKAKGRRREVQNRRNARVGSHLYFFTHLGRRLCMDATKESRQRLCRLLNHSRQGNLRPVVLTLDLRPHLVLLAARRIRPGEELTFDYNDRSREALRHNPWLKD